MNKGILFISIAFIILGAFLILDASSISSILRYQHDTPYFFLKKQLQMIGLGLVGALILLKVPTNTYKKFSLLGCLGLLGAMLFALVESKATTNISTVTITIGSATFMPAEFLKVALVMYMGSFYATWDPNEKNAKIKMFAPLLIGAISVIIVALGGDFGTAAIMCALMALTFVVIPTKDILFKKIKCLAYGGLALCILFLMFGYLVLPDRVLEDGGRLARFYYKDACERYEDTGYQVCNGYIAMNNGGLTGVGLGNSTQKYLYLDESHTDFIFPIIIEEFGVLSGILIILLYMVLIYLIFRVASNTHKLQNSIICYGLGIYFMLHILINLAGVLGVFPVTGVPLPFLSYGGSFCISMIGTFAIIQRINIENRFHYEKLEKPLK